MGKSRGHDRGAILDSVFSPPSSDKNRTTLPTRSYETTPTSPRSPMDTGRTPPPTGALSPLFVRKGLLSGQGSCRRHLPGLIPSGGGAASGCRYVSAESSRRTNDGGGLSPLRRLENLSLQWPDTHLAWPGPRVSAVRCTAATFKSPHTGEFLLPRTPVHLYRDGLHLYAVQGNKQQDTSSRCRYVDVTLLDQRPQL